MKDIIEVITDAWPSNHVLKDHVRLTWDEAKELASKKGINGVFLNNIRYSDAQMLFVVSLLQKRVRKELLEWLNDANIEDGVTREFEAFYSTVIGFEARKYSDCPRACRKIVMVLRRDRKGTRPFKCVTMYPATTEDAEVIDAESTVSDAFLEKVNEIARR